MLSLWEAERFEGEIGFGRTHPRVIECRQIDTETLSANVEGITVSPKTETRLLLVKLPGNELPARGMFAEVYGNLLAREFGLTTARPALVHISPDFITALQQSPHTRPIALKPGLAVGCDYLKGLFQVVPGVFRNNRESGDVQAIYGFDLLFQNPDRRRGNPNCAYYHGGVLAYDFELAFSFLLPIIGKPVNAWNVHELGIHSKHLFYEELKQRRDTLDWKPFVQSLRAFDAERLETLFASVLPEWRGYADKIAAHLDAVRSHAEQVEEMLIRSLL